MYCPKTIESSVKIKCPMCGKTNLQYVTETDTKVETSGGYSGTKGCMGYLLLGPLGLLCGNCGSSKKTTVTDIHKHFWVCSDCGHKFPTLEDLDAEIQQKKKAIKGLVPGIVSCIFLIILGLMLEVDLLTIMGVVFLILIALLVPLLKKQTQEKEAEYAELEKKIKV